MFGKCSRSVNIFRTICLWYLFATLGILNGPPHPGVNVKVPFWGEKLLEKFVFNLFVWFLRKKLRRVAFVGWEAARLHPQLLGCDRPRQACILEWLLRCYLLPKSPRLLVKNHSKAGKRPFCTKKQKPVPKIHKNIDVCQFWGCKMLANVPF